MSDKRIYQFCLDTQCEDILNEIPRGARSEWVRNLMKQSKIEQINQPELEDQYEKQNKVKKGEIIGKAYSSYEM